MGCYDQSAMHQDQPRMDDHGRAERAHGFHSADCPIANVVEAANAKRDEAAAYGYFLHWRLVCSFHPIIKSASPAEMSLADSLGIPVSALSPYIASQNSTASHSSMLHGPMPSRQSGLSSRSASQLPALAPSFTVL